MHIRDPWDPFVKPLTPVNPWQPDPIGYPIETTPYPPSQRRITASGLGGLQIDTTSKNWKRYENVWVDGNEHVKILNIALPGIPPESVSVARVRNEIVIKVKVDNDRKNNNFARLIGLGTETYSFELDPNHRLSGESMQFKLGVLTIPVHIDKDIEEDIEHFELGGE